MTTLDQAVDQMRANGMPEFPGGLPRVNTPRIIRYGPKNKAWYRLHEFIGRTGKRFIAGAYGIWGALDPTKIEADWTGMDEADRARIEREQLALEKRERDKRERLAKAAALRGRQQYRHALDVGPCAYLDRKGVKLQRPLKVKEDGTLVVPMYRFEGEQRELVGVQKIGPDGVKKFNKGMNQIGAACLFGRLNAELPIYIAEGVATALSIREALEQAGPVLVAFNAGNLLPVARMARQRHPESEIVICADDDWRTICDRHQREGLAAPMAIDAADRPDWCKCLPGLVYANQAAREVGGRVVLPAFQSSERGEKDTDFNDLHRLDGIEAVRKQLLNGAAPAPAKAKPQREKKKPPPDPAKFRRALDSWTLIRGTDTVFDATVWSIVKISHLKLSEGEGFVKWWLAAEDRRTVWRDDVVFEPAGASASQLNLFRGMPLPPDASKACDRIIALLQYLCGEEGQDQAPVTDWILKWCALPLQRPGAKLTTSVVMHGADEGAGKNMFWGVLRAVYGQYGGIITQVELESQFTGWASQKLMLIANEVVSRAELRHQGGRLRNIITEPEIWINEKHLPARLEANHINFVFLSNEVLPQMLNHKDRRYCVVHTPEKKPRQYYADVGEQIAAGAAAGFHAYLLGLDLGDFDEHTKPPMTDAKRRLLDLSKNSAQLFIDELREGLMGHPWGPCSTRDLHVAYMRWCRRTNERVVMSEKRFLGEVDHYLNVPASAHQRRRLPRGRQAISTPTSFVVLGDRPQDAPENWIEKSVVAFEESLRGEELEGQP